jgi:uncharacterized protein DUF6804
MFTSVEVQGPREAWTPPPAKALDPGVWQTWLEKNREESRRTTAAWMRTVKWVSIAALLAAAGMWSHLGAFDVAIRFVVTAGAIVVMSQAFQARQYSIGAAFAAIALLYNPIVPVFDFSGGWQRAVVAASTIPFAASLAWRRAAVVH